MVNQRDLKKLSMDFLLASCFGQSKDLVVGAIDKAYVDMAAHTLRSFSKDETEQKWDCRYAVTETIYIRVKKYPNGEKTFVDWNKKTVQSIEDIYNKSRHNLDYGQAQKWVNMTIKYLEVLRMVLGESDERLQEISSFLANTSHENYPPAIDSYVLKGTEVGAMTWSSLKKEEYDEIQNILMEEGFTFVEELEKWEDFSEKYREYEKGSYGMYLKLKEMEISEKSQSIN